MNRISGFAMWLVLPAGLVVMGCGNGGHSTDVMQDVFIPFADSGNDVAGVDLVGIDIAGADLVVHDNGGSDVIAQDIAGQDTQTADSTGTDLAVEDVAVEDTVQADTATPCWLGEMQCSGPAEQKDGKTCDKAKILTRVMLATDNGIKYGNPDTINELNGGTGNANDDDLSDQGCPLFGEGDDLWCKDACADPGKDHFYQVYLLPGDYFSLNVSDYLIFQHPDYGYHIDFMLKVYKGQCPLNRDKLVSCTNAEDKSSVATTNNIQIKPLTEAEAGWYTIVVDSSDIEEAGTYTLTALLFSNSEYTGDWSLCCDFPTN